MAANVIDLGNPQVIYCDDFYLESPDTYTEGTIVFTIKREGEQGGFGTIICDLNRKETMVSATKSVSVKVIGKLQEQALQLGAFFRMADGLDPYRPRGFWGRLKWLFFGDLEFDDEED